MTKSLRKSTGASAFLIALSVAVPVAAQAQIDPAATPPPVVVNSGRTSGAGLGVGAAAFISGASGLSVVYDMPVFHIEGIFGFESLAAEPNRVTRFRFGARGWYHLHSGTNSDFSLGGGFGVLTSSGPGDGDSATATLIEPGMQARIFLTPNFTFNGTAGFSMVFGENVGGTVEGFGLNAQLLAGLGFTYFFR